MSVMEEISKLSKNGCDDALLNYICDNYDEIECELNGKEYKEPKKHDRNFCIDCNMEMLIDYQKSILVSTNCGLCEYHLVYVNSYNHTIKPLRRKCIYRRSDNFKVIMNKFLFSGKQFEPYLLYVTITEYNVILDLFNIVSYLYDKHKPLGGKSFIKLPLRFETNIDNARESRI